MKRIIFVSSGRCGTRRIYELLNNCLPSNVAVVHQMRFSRLANILGTLMVTTKGKIDFSKLYEPLTKRYYKGKDIFISTDPLSSMILPTEIISSQDTCIVHIVRLDHDFAKSIYTLSRNRIPSFVAHNLIPFWQPGIIPLENIFNKKIQGKYASANRLKNRYFEERYRTNPHYMKINHVDLFQPACLENIIDHFLGLKIFIPDSALARKSNESQRSESKRS